MNYRHASADKASQKEKFVLDQIDNKIMRKSYGPTVCLINHNKHMQKHPVYDNHPDILLNYFLIILENQRLNLQIQHQKDNYQTFQLSKSNNTHQIVRITQQHHSQLRELKHSLQRQHSRLIQQKNRQIAHKNKLLNEYELANQDLKARLKSMQNSQSNLLSRIKSMSTQIQQLRASNYKQNLQFMQNSADFQTTLSMEKNDINIYKQKNKKLEALLADHKYLLNSKNDKIKQMQAKLNSFQSQAHSQPNNTKESRQINTDFSSFGKEHLIINQLRQQLSLKNTKVQNLIEQVNFFKEKIDEQQRILNSWSNNQQIYHTEKYQMEKKLNEAYLQRDYLNKKLKKMNEKLQLQQLLSQDKIVSLNQSIKRKQQQLAKKDREITDLKHKRLQKTAKKPVKPFIQEMKEERLLKSYSTSALMNRNKISQTDLKNIMNQVMQLKISNERMGNLIDNTSNNQYSRYYNEYYHQ